MNSVVFGGSGSGQLFPEAGSFLSENEAAGGASCCSFAIAGLAPCSHTDLRKTNEPIDIFTKNMSELKSVSTHGFLADLIGAVATMPVPVPWNLQAGALL